MGMVIHDDFWEACQAMPEKQRAPFLYAIAQYRFEKVEPKGNPPWLPTFIAIKQRLDLGDEKSERGRKMAEARWGKKNGDSAQAEGNENAVELLEQPPEQNAQAYTQAYAQAHAQAYTQAQNNPDAEVEIENEYGVNPPIIPPSFSLACLAAFNEVFGVTYSTIPERCRLNLERLAGTYSLEDVRHMIEYKRDEWQGTRYAKALTPNTLFSPDHFEQYIHQSKSEEEVTNDFAKYD